MRNPGTKATSASAEATLAPLLDAAIEMHSADWGYLFLREGKALRLALARGPEGGGAPELPGTLPTGELPSGLYESSSEDLPPPLREVLRRAGLESLLVQSLGYGPKASGLLLLAWETAVEVDDQDRTEVIGEFLERVLRRLRVGRTRTAERSRASNSIRGS